MAGGAFSGERRAGAGGEGLRPRVSARGLAYGQLVLRLGDAVGLQGIGSPRM